MKIHIIEQYDQEDENIIYKWVAVDEQTARDLWEAEVPLFYVREDAEGLIEDLNDLEIAIKNNAVCPDENYLWIEDFEEGAQNRARNNNNQSFEDWCIDKIESYF